MAVEAVAHSNSILGRANLAGDGRVSTMIVRGQRRADLDLYHMRRWARNGFVSLPGNMGPRDEAEGE